MLKVDSSLSSEDGISSTQERCISPRPMGCVGLPKATGSPVEIDDAIAEAVRTGLLPVEGRLILAVSGGLDSMVMTAALSSAPFEWTLFVATVEHGLHAVSQRRGVSVSNGATA